MKPGRGQTSALTLGMRNAGGAAISHQLGRVLALTEIRGNLDLAVGYDPWRFFRALTWASASRLR